MVREERLEGKQGEASATIREDRGTEKREVHELLSII